MNYWGVGFGGGAVGSEMKARYSNADSNACRLGTFSF